MAQGRKALRKIQVGRESTNGTPVDPRFLWRGNGDMPDDQRELVNVEEQVGIFGGTDRTYIPKLMAELSLADTEATYEQLPWLFNALGLGTFNGAQGSTQGASGSTGLFYWNIPTTTAPTTLSYTIQAGDNVEVEEMPYSVVKEVTLSFAAGEAMKVSAAVMARTTGTTADRSWTVLGTMEDVEEILASNGTFYLDPISGAYGAAAVTAGNILGGEVKLTATWEPKFSVDAGVLYFHTAVWTDIEVSGNLILEHQASGTYGAAGNGQKSKWRNEDPQLLRMNWPGGTIPIGTTHVNKLLRVDLPIKWSKFSALGDQNGNDIVTGDFMSKYNISAPAAGRGTITLARRGTCPISGAF